MCSIRSVLRMAIRVGVRPMKKKLRMEAATSRSMGRIGRTCIKLLAMGKMAVFMKISLSSAKKLRMIGSL